MKKTSRRTFGKEVVGALAALPIASVLNAQTASPQKQKSSAAKKTQIEQVFTSHDTPPPVVIGEGSVLVERHGEYLAGDIVTTGGRKRHHIRPDAGKNKVFPAHIKVLDGSGEILYRNDRSKECVVTFGIEDDSGGTLTVTAAASPVVGGRRTFVIDMDDVKSLDKTTEKPTAKKRDVRYKLKHGSKEFSIVDVKIVEGADLLYKVTLANLPSMGDDFKVMIWLEQEV